MALSVGSMKEDIINALKDMDKAVEANKKFGDAILKNICDNIEITYGWAAALTSIPFTVDPQVTFNATVSGGGLLTPSSTFSEMLIKLAALIKGLVISPPAGFLLAPLTFNSAGVLSVTMANEDNQDAAMTNFCSQVIASIISTFINTVPSAGTHAPYSGATIGMVIR